MPGGRYRCRQPISADGDPFIWLEQVDGPEARAWVAARNVETEKALCDDQFERDRAAVLDISRKRDFTVLRVATFCPRHARTEA